MFAAPVDSALVIFYAGLVMVTTLLYSLTSLTGAENVTLS